MKVGCSENTDNFCFGAQDQFYSCKNRFQTRPLTSRKLSRSPHSPCTIQTYSQMKVSFITLSKSWCLCWRETFWLQWYRPQGATKVLKRQKWWLQMAPGETWQPDNSTKRGHFRRRIGPFRETFTAPKRFKSGYSLNGHFVTWLHELFKGHL